MSLGFQLRALPRYERQAVIERDGFVALLAPAPGGGIQQMSAAGLLLGENIALLVERAGAAVFVAKGREVAATPELLERYERFRADLRSALQA